MATIPISTAKRTLVDKAGVDTYNISADAERVTIAGKLMGDTLNIEGLSSDYMVTAAGRTLTLKSDEQTIRLQLKAGDGLANIAFLDGTVSATHTTKGTFLGEAKLSRKAIEIEEDALNENKTSASVFEGGGGGGAASPSTLTVDAETVTGSAGDDTINGVIFTDAEAGPTYNAFDSIDGGDGTDTLRLVSNDDEADVDAADLTIADLKSIEILQLSLTGGKAISGDYSEIDSLTSAALRTTEGGAISFQHDTITAVTMSGAGTDTDYTVEGAKISAVTITNAGKENKGGAVEITSDALASVTLTGLGVYDDTDGEESWTEGDGGVVDVTISNTSDAEDGETDAVSVTVNGSGVSLFDDDAEGEIAYDSVSVKATGNSYVELKFADATAATLSAAGTTELVIDKDTNALTKLTLSGAGDITADITTDGEDTDVADLATIDAKLVTGDLTLTMAATVTTLTTGSGDDTVTLVDAVASGSKYDLGAGDDIIKIAEKGSSSATIIGGAGTDTITADGDVGTILKGSSLKAFTGFEQIGLGDDSKGTLDLGDIKGITAVLVDGTLDGDVTVEGAAAGVGLKFTDDATLGHSISYELADATGTKDTLAMTIGTASSDEAIVLDGDAEGDGEETITALDIENFTIASLGKGKEADHEISLIADALTTLTITGGSTSLTVTYEIDGDAQEGEADVKSSETLSTINASAFTGALDLSGVSLGAKVTITTGKGADTILLGDGDATVNTGAGADTITLGGVVGDSDGADNFFAEAEDGAFNNDFANKVVEYDVTTGAGVDVIEWAADTELDGDVQVDVSDFTFGEKGDALQWADVADLSAYEATGSYNGEGEYEAEDTVETVFISAAIAKALTSANGAGINYVIVDTAENLEEYLTAENMDDNEVYLIYNTTDGTLYASDAEGAYNEDNVVAIIGKGTLTADNFRFIEP